MVTSKIAPTRGLTIRGFQEDGSDYIPASTLMFQDRTGLKFIKESGMTQKTGTRTRRLTEVSLGSTSTVHTTSGVATATRSDH